MHEMSIAQSLFEIIEEAARANGIGRVTVVRMRIGEMAGVVPDALEFCLEVLARGTAAEGARLDVTLVPPRGSCGGCGRSFPARDWLAECPGCGSPAVAIAGGDELCLDELEGE